MKSPIKKSSKTPRLVRDSFQDKMFLIPSLITVMGNFCGFLAIVSAIRGHFEYAVTAIAVSFVFDGLDGRVARRLNATSEFGREFDSLSDIVAFGVAPAIIVYLWGFQLHADEFGLVVAFALVACGATRLARFNVDTTHRHHFVGLPIPAAAAALCSIVYCWPGPMSNMVAVSALLVYTALIAALMVSTLPFISVKHMRLTDGNPRLNLGILATIVAIGWYQHKLVIMVICNLYALSGIILPASRRYFPRQLAALEQLFGLDHSDKTATDPVQEEATA